MTTVTTTPEKEGKEQKKRSRVVELLLGVTRTASGKIGVGLLILHFVMPYLDTEHQWFEGFFQFH